MRRATWTSGQVGVRSDPPVVEETVRPTCPIVRVLSLIGVSVFALALAPFARSQEVNVSGRYQCAEAKVRGKVVPCTSAPLTLKDDGRFELRGWEGSYMVNGLWVELSDSTVRSRAKIEPGHKIVFRYRGKHGWCEMIYQRRVAELGKTSLS
jgi:hypothetical protein